ncbi:MAG: MBL fold metallo-hydrolase, partial [Sandaracinaceae bacterium]
AEEGARRFEALGLRWRIEDLTPIGRWLTPSYARRRFDTELYLLTLPRPVPPDPTVFELQDAEWITPEAAHARWAAGGALITPALAHLIRTLRDVGPEPAALRAVHGAAGQECLRWEVAPFVQMMPVRTPTLPPATHTNAYLVGSRQAVVVEPSTPYAEEQDRFVRWVEESRREGIEPIAMVATHHHPDHVGGAAVLGERLGLPLWAHAETAARLPKLHFERLLSDGDVVALDGPTPMTLEILHTPGHAQGHICLREPSSGVMMVGDMVASIGTILVEPGDGDMAVYLEQLARLRDVGASMLLPAHGWPIRDPRALLSHYIAHRLAREEKVLGALGEAPQSVAELVPTAYDDAPKAVWPLAALATEAHLLKLGQEGRAVRSDRGWSRGVEPA